MNDNINLKIYSITSVWLKWQVIIPKDSRIDLSINIWEEFEIVLVDNSAFGIWRKKNMDCEIDKNIKNIEKKWNINIWTKFQFVIPAEIRKELWIESGDNLIIIWRNNEWLAFVKNDRIDFLLDYIKEVTNK